MVNSGRSVEDFFQPTLDIPQILVPSIFLPLMQELSILSDQCEETLEPPSLWKCLQRWLILVNKIYPWGLDLKNTIKGCQFILSKASTLIPSPTPVGHSQLPLNLSQSPFWVGRGPYKPVAGKGTCLLSGCWMMCSRSLSPLELIHHAFPAHLAVLHFESTVLIIMCICHSVLTNQLCVCVCVHTVSALCQAFYF